MDLRCQAVGCGEDRQIELVRESPSGTKLIHCSVCGRDSVLFPASKAICPKCSGVGFHLSGCEELGKV